MHLIQSPSKTELAFVMLMIYMAVSGIILHLALTAKAITLCLL